MTFWYRYSLKTPEYLQDFDTWILTGNYTHIYNVETREWFWIGNVPKPEKSLCKPWQVMIQVPFRRWYKTVGKYGIIEVMEDLLHIHIVGRVFHGTTKKGTPLRGAAIYPAKTSTSEDISD